MFFRSLLEAVQYCSLFSRHETWPRLCFKLMYQMSVFCLITDRPRTPPGGICSYPNWSRKVTK